MIAEDSGLQWCFKLPWRYLSGVEVFAGKNKRNTNLLSAKIAREGY